MRRKPGKKDDRGKIRDALLELKNTRFFKDDFDRNFIRISGLHRATIQQVSLNTVPTIENIQKWVEACGLTLSEFFKSLEDPAGTTIEHPLILSARALLQQGDPENISFVRKLIETLVAT